MTIVNRAGRLAALVLDRRPYDLAYLVPDGVPELLRRRREGRPGGGLYTAEATTPDRAELLRQPDALRAGQRSDTAGGPER
jgi:hypothetical protein